MNSVEARAHLKHVAHCDQATLDHRRIGDQRQNGATESAAVFVEKQRRIGAIATGADNASGRPPRAQSAAHALWVLP